MTVKEVFDYLFSVFNNEDACYAIIGNLMAESGLKANNMQNSYEKRTGYNDTTYTNAVDTGAYTKQKFVHDAIGYGLCQWTYWTRKQALYEYLKGKGLSIADEKGQLDFLIAELKAKPALFRSLCYEVGYEHLTEVFMKQFERPADQSKNAVLARVKLACNVKTLIEKEEAVFRKTDDTTFEYYPKSDYNGRSLIDALKSINVDSSKTYRTKIAKANGIDNYTGKASENNKLLQMFKEGVLIKCQE